MTSLTVPTVASKKTHQRSQSDASALISPSTKTSNAGKLSLGNLSSGRAFDNGCICFDNCQSVVNDLKGKKTETECTCSVRFT